MFRLTQITCAWFLVLVKLCNIAVAHRHRLTTTYYLLSFIHPYFSNKWLLREMLFLSSVWLSFATFNVAWCQQWTAAESRTKRILKICVFLSGATVDWRKGTCISLCQSRMQEVGHVCSGGDTSCSRRQIDWRQWPNVWIPLWCR